MAIQLSAGTVAAKVLLDWTHAGSCRVCLTLSLSLNFPALRRRVPLSPISLGNRTPPSRVPRSRGRLQSLLGNRLERLVKEEAQGHTALRCKSIPFRPQNTHYRSLAGRIAHRLG